MQNTRILDDQLTGKQSVSDPVAFERSFACTNQGDLKEIIMAMKRKTPGFTSWFGDDVIKGLNL